MNMRQSLRREANFTKFIIGLNEINIFVSNKDNYTRKNLTTCQQDVFATGL